MGPRPRVRILDHRYSREIPPPVGPGSPLTRERKKREKERIKKEKDRIRDPNLWHQPNGRFKHGNPGGNGFAPIAGNQYALRRRLMDQTLNEIPLKDIRDFVLGTLFKGARAGDPTMVRLFLERFAGRIPYTNLNLDVETSEFDPADVEQFL